MQILCSKKKNHFNSSKEPFSFSSCILFQYRCKSGKDQSVIKRIINCIKLQIIFKNNTILSKAFLIKDHISQTLVASFIYLSDSAMSPNMMKVCERRKKVE